MIKDMKILKWHIAALRRYALCSLFSILYSLLGACAKYDPILPGDRTPVFAGEEPTIQNTEIPRDVLVRAIGAGNSSKLNTQHSTLKYEQTPDNEIFEIGADGARRRIFSGFPTAAHVSARRAPLAVGGFIYAGLSTGEVVKINPKTREVKWAADIYKPSILTGGSGGVLDIVAQPVLDDKYVYAGGLGGAFCKLRDSSGEKIWCNWISVSAPFSIYTGLAFVISTDDGLYAINTNDGGIYWRRDTRCTSAPELVQIGDDFIIKCTAGRRKEEFRI